MSIKDLHIEMWPIEDVKPYEQNAKIHDEAQVKRIAKSVTEFGWDQPIVVDKGGVIIKGHGRRAAGEYLGMKEVPVLVRADLTDEQVRAARLADNRVAIGDLDSSILQKELADLNFDLTGIFDAKELTFMEADLSLMNDGAIVEDLDAAVAAQSSETMAKIEETDARPVRIEKALGFKTISGSDERVVSRFMATAEAETGLAGGAAFISWLKRSMEVTA